MKPVITTKKHYVQISLTTVLAGANLNTELVRAKALLDVNTSAEIVEGSVVKAVFVELWVRAGDTAPGSTLITLSKIPGVGGNPTFADQIALHGWDNKKNIFYHTQGLTNDQDADAIPFVRQWFKIPKGKQRFGLEDTLTLSVAAQALDNIICGFATYKEYS